MGSAVIPPLSLVRLMKITDDETSWKKKECEYLGKEFRIGYYRRQDGLDCVWLVDDDGGYNEAVDQEMIRTHFKVLEPSDESDMFGDARLIIGPRRKHTG